MSTLRNLPQARALALFAPPVWRRTVFALLCFTCLCAASPVACFAADAPDARVFYINAYHRGYIWSDAIEQGLREAFRASGKHIELSVEYLDSRRFTGGAQNAALAEAMAIKYKSYRPDIVVVSDNPAFDFAIKYRARLFPGLPLVFCGYNYFRPEAIKGIDNVTGVNEEISIADTVAMALKVHPRTRALAFITSTSDPSTRRIHQFVEQSVFPQYRGRYDLVELQDATLQDIKVRLGGLPPETLVFLSGRTSDHGTGREYTPEENGRLVSAASPFPVYALWDFHIGTGVLGGHILTGLDQGRAAAGLALRVLAGTPADTIPVVMTSPATDMFDYTAMQRFGIGPDQLPAGSVIVNRPHSLWHSYRWQIMGTTALVALETVLLAALLFLMRQRRAALAALAAERAALEARVAERTLELQAREERFRLLFDRASEGIVIISAEGKLLAANESFARMHGYTVEEIQTLSLRELDTPEALRQAPGRIARILSGEAITFEAENYRKDGSVVPIEVSASMLVSGGERVIQSFVRDITDRRKAEARIQQMNAELEQRVEQRTRDLQEAYDEMESFAYSISHDLRTPLRAIEGFSSMLETEYATRLDERGKDYFRRVRTAAKRMAALIDDLLNLSRIARQTVHSRQIDLSAMAAEVARELQATNRERAVEWVIAPGLSAPGDPILIRSVLQNLIGNAWKYSSKRATARIEFGVIASGDAPTYFVRDNGAGFDATYADKLFGAFQRLHSAEEFPGSGIGLATVRRIVRRHGGRVWAEGQVDAGATFYFTLPTAGGPKRQL